MRIFFVTAELRPIIKVTGLADLIKQLAAELGKKHHVSVIMPCYGTDGAAENGVETPLEAVTYFEKHPARARRISGQGNYDIFLIGGHPVFNEIQCDRDLEDMDRQEDLSPWMFFSYAAHDLILTLLEREKAASAVTHCFGWAPGLLPALLKASRKNAQEMKIVTTVDILEDQGKCAARKMHPFFRDNYYLAMGLQDGETFNFLKCGILNSDVTGTVSPRFAETLTQRPHAHGLEDIFEGMREKGKLVGILNGIDTRTFDPAHYPLLKAVNANFASEDSPEDVRKKKSRAKMLLQEKACLPTDPDVPLISMGHRFVPQKNFELLADAIEPLMKLDPRPQIFIRTWNEPEVSDERFELWWRLVKYARKYRFNIAFFEPYDREPISGQEDLYIDRFLYYAASDLFLMPSLWEPCGLCQLEAMRFGAVPVVSDVGGLGDSVRDFNPKSGKGTGFVLKSWRDSRQLVQVVTKALDMRKSQPKLWNKLLRNVLSFPLSITHTAEEYIRRLYS